MDYQRIKRGNVFENLYKIDEDGREMSADANLLTQTLRDFTKVDDWIEKVDKVVSEEYVFHRNSFYPF